MMCCPYQWLVHGASGRLLCVLVIVGFALFASGHYRQQSTAAQTLSPAEQNAAPEQPAEPPSTANIVRQGFPAAQADPNNLAKSDTAWEIEWDMTNPTNRPFYPPGCTLRIRSAKFMWKDRYGRPQWVTVARMLELAEIYVPYDNGFTAFLDIHDMSFYMTPARKEFLGPNCVAPGEILKSSNPYWSGRVYKEVHDDGIRWMSAETSPYNRLADRARRGQKLLIWACYYGANYRYLIEYGFGDDGVLSVRIGPTGHNLLDRRDDHGDTHLHIGCWRFEPDLGDPVSNRGGPKENEVLLVRRIFDENAERFSQVAKPFAKNNEGQASEGSARWEAQEFTTVRVQSRVRKNAHGRAIAFDLIPQRYGALRQLQPEGGSSAANMDFINYDFWVTRTEPGNTAYIDVPQYASKRRPLEGYPTTIWTLTPALHFPRTEDFGPADGKSSYDGAAVTFWTGFFFKPRDLFDSTPLYQGRPIQFE
jgi:Copper amine oxidase, enzyme domain